jgi:ribose transport system substrate-binding protein
LRFGLVFGYGQFRLVMEAPITYNFSQFFGSLIMPRIIAWLSLCCCLLMVMLPGGGCRKPPEPPPAATKVSKPPAIGVSLARLDGPWRAQLKADIEAAAAKHPDLPLVVEDAGNDAERQRAQIEEFVKARARAIIICPQDAQSLTESVAKVFEAGIPVVVLDRALVGDKYSCFIAPDWKQIGAAAGKWLAGRLHGKGKIVEIEGPVDSAPAQQLHEAFRAALRDPGYHFVFEGHVDPPKVDAAKLMSEAIGRLQQFDAVFACDDAAACAAHQTAHKAGREKGVLFVGVGGLSGEGRAYVSRGDLSAMLLVPTGGAEAVDAVVKLLGGEKVPKTIVLETRMFTQ